MSYSKPGNIIAAGFPAEVWDRDTPSKEHPSDLIDPVARDFERCMAEVQAAQQWLSDRFDLSYGGFKLKTSVEEDLRFPASDGADLVGRVPDDVVWNSGLVKDYDNQSNAVNEKAQAFTVQFEHGVEDGHFIEPHIHYGAGDANAGVARFTLDASWADINGTFAAMDQVVLLLTMPEAANYHALGSFGEIAYASTNVSSMMLCTLRRTSSHEDDTYAGSVYLMEFDVHAYRNTLGRDPT